jgi:hypothetical protein
MNESEARWEIRRLGPSGLLVFTEHARDRMLQRGVNVHDVRHALSNATTVDRSSLGQASDWTTKGPDAFGDELTLGVVLSGGVIVITVY